MKKSSEDHTSSINIPTPSSSASPKSISRNISSLRALVATGALGLLSAGITAISMYTHPDPRAQASVRVSEDRSTSTQELDKDQQQGHDTEEDSDSNPLVLPGQLPSLHILPDVHHEQLEESMRRAQRIIHTPMPRVPDEEADLQHAVDEYNNQIAKKNPPFKELREKLQNHYPNHHLVSQIVQGDSGEEHEKIVLAPRSDIPSDGDFLAQSRIVIRIENGAYIIEGSPYFHKDYSCIPVKADNLEELERLIDNYFSLLSLKSEWWRESSNSGTEPESEDFKRYLLRNGFPNFAGMIEVRKDLLLNSSAY